MEINFARIGEKIRAIRLQKGFTQEFLAGKVNVNTSHISNIENNRVKISLPTLVHICNALDTTVDYLLSDEYTDSSSVMDQIILEELKKCDMETKEKILNIIRILQQSGNNLN